MARRPKRARAGARPKGAASKLAQRRNGRPRVDRKALRSPRGRRGELLTAPNGIASIREPVELLTDEQARALAHACRNAALEKKGENVLLLDIRDRASFADFFVIATGRSVLQARSIADGVVEASENDVGAPLRTEGYNEGSWILIDYGPVIVHVFTLQAREFYNLERLWGKPAPAPKKR